MTERNYCSRTHPHSTHQMKLLLYCFNSFLKDCQCTEVSLPVSKRVKNKFRFDIILVMSRKRNERKFTNEFPSHLIHETRQTKIKLSSTQFQKFQRIYFNFLFYLLSLVNLSINVFQSMEFLKIKLISKNFPSPFKKQRNESQRNVLHAKNFSFYIEQRN